MHDKAHKLSKRFDRLLTVDAVYFPRNGGNVTLVMTKVTKIGYTNRL